MTPEELKAEILKVKEEAKIKAYKRQIKYLCGIIKVSMPMFSDNAKQLMQSAIDESDELINN